jgi:S1-C subfamily serine protease
VRRASLGIGAQNTRLPRRYVRYFDLPADSAVRVVEVADGGPAKSAGIEAGDILVDIDGSPIDGIDALHRMLDAARIGQGAELSLIRRDRKLTVSLVPGELAAS